MFGDHIVLAYSILGSVVALYVVVIVSLSLPQCVVVSALRMLLLFLACEMVFWMCFENVSLGSQVSPRILGSFTVGNVVLSICSVRVVRCSAGSGVKSVVVVLSAFSVSWLSLVQVCMSWRYCCTCCCAACGLVWEDRMVMSSA